MFSVGLLHGLGGARTATLREPSGRDELALTGTDTAAAVAILDRLLVVTADGGLQPGDAARLPSCDRDRLLAALYRALYGDGVEGASRCRDCGEAVELSFGLGDLLAERAPERAEIDELGDGWFSVRGGPRFRLPTSEDELAVAALPAADAGPALVARCTEGDATGAAAAAIEAAMERVGPVLCVDLEARCPECGAHQTVAFDIQRHVLGALAGERHILTREIHRIAGAYAWSLDEILGLGRRDRRAFVRYIEAERGAGTGGLP